GAGGGLVGVGEGGGVAEEGGSRGGAGANRLVDEVEREVVDAQVGEWPQASDAVDGWAPLPRVSDLDETHVDVDEDVAPWPAVVRLLEWHMAELQIRRNSAMRLCPTEECEELLTFHTDFEPAG